jgi:hypothetical protein
MTVDYLSIGSVPCEEECAQVGRPDYYTNTRIECTAFKNQLLRVFSEPPASTWFAVKSFPHDFGTYHEVVCHFDEDSEESRNYAFNAESNTPMKWDEESKKELASKGYKLELEKAKVK